MADTDIDPPSLIDAGTTMRSAAAEFGQQLTAFQARLAGIGPAFGDDETGSILGIAYDAASGYVLEVMTEAQEEIDFAGQDLIIVANAHQATEDDNTEQFHALLSRLGGS
jgi:hypothetical protein